MAVCRGPFVGDEKWQTIHDALNGAGVESMQGKWEEMFGGKEEEVVEDVKVKKSRKKVAKEKVATTPKRKKTTVKRKTRAKK